MPLQVRGDPLWIIADNFDGARELRLRAAARKCSTLQRFEGGPESGLRLVFHQFSILAVDGNRAPHGNVERSTVACCTQRDFVHTPGRDCGNLIAVSAPHMVGHRAHALLRGDVDFIRSAMLAFNARSIR